VARVGGGRLLSRSVQPPGLGGTPAQQPGGGEPAWRELCRLLWAPGVWDWFSSGRAQTPVLGHGTKPAPRGRRNGMRQTDKQKRRKPVGAASSVCFLTERGQARRAGCAPSCIIHLRPSPGQTGQRVPPAQGWRWARWGHPPRLPRCERIFKRGETEMPMGMATQGGTAPPGSPQALRSYAPGRSQLNAGLALSRSKPGVWNQRVKQKKTAGLGKSCEKLPGGQRGRAEGRRRGLWHGLPPAGAGEHRMPDL